jgi:hypothetical protein
MKIRKLNRSIHRDLGYIFFFLTVIYGLSGIALNHLDDWNPNYIVKTNNFNIETTLKKDDLNKAEIIALIDKYTPKEKYKNHYFKNETSLKIFIKGGSIIVNLEDYSGYIETSKRRPLFHQANYLHYNPQKLWTIISDIFAASLIILAFSGLFILKGKSGITGRGAWLTTFGILVPIIFLLIYYWKVF